MRDRTTLTAALTAVAPALAGPAQAQAQVQDWPARPLTMVVPFAAGGPVDVLGRILAQHLGEVLGKQVIIDNAPGGGGMTGSLRVSQVRPTATVRARQHRDARAQPDAVEEAALQCRDRFRPGGARRRRRPCRWCARNFPRTTCRTYRLRQGEPGQDAVRLRRHRHLLACRMRAAQPDDRIDTSMYPIAAAAPHSPT